MPSAPPGIGGFWAIQNWLVVLKANWNITVVTFQHHPKLDGLWTYFLTTNQLWERYHWNGEPETVFRDKLTLSIVHGNNRAQQKQTHFSKSTCLILFVGHCYPHPFPFWPFWASLCPELCQHGAQTVLLKFLYGLSKICTYWHILFVEDDPQAVVGLQIL